MFENNPEKPYDTPKKGEFRKKHTWLQLGYGTDLAIGNLDSKQTSENFYSASINQKFRLNKTLSHGFGGGVYLQTHSLSEKGLTTLLHNDWDKGSLRFWGLDANYFVRIYFSRKYGTVPGWYCDLAAFGQFNFHQRTQFTKGKTTIKTVGGDFAERYAAGFETRLGFRTIALFARYKLVSESDVSFFTSMDLPKWSVGLSLDIGLN
ncbi:MAG: hypothetical protein LBP96_05360 [Bacteroidales bacterium]|nr:hypothetical protein [Bacteroidales bacterium]